MNHYIRWFSEIGMADLPTVGGKNASLGELFRELTPEGIRVPAGFAITGDASPRSSANVACGAGRPGWLGAHATRVTVRESVSAASAARE